MKLGRCWVEQTPVKAPGTANTTTRPPAKSASLVTGAIPSMPFSRKAPAAAARRSPRASGAPFAGCGTGRPTYRRSRGEANGESPGMRIIGGRHRGLMLAGLGAGDPPGAPAPTADRVRESLFNLLAHGDYGDPPPPEGRRVLDLFAGTGALGLEALSRGAAFATFVDQGAKALALLRRNLGLPGRRRDPRVVSRDATRLGRNQARPSTSSSSTRPTAAASASARSPRRSPAAGSRRARSSSGRRASTQRRRPA